MKNKYNKMYDRGLFAGIVGTTCVSALLFIALMLWYRYQLDQVITIAEEILELAKR